MDIVIPIVFPDYKIFVEIKKSKVNVLPWFNFDDFTVPSYQDKVSNLGHAGVLFINGKNGASKYYEYGRYDPQNIGLVVKAKNLPDAKVINNKVSLESLKKPLEFISKVSGQSGRIQGVFIEIEDKFDAMLAHAEFRKSQNINPGRKKYDLLTDVTQQNLVVLPHEKSRP